MVVDDDSIQRMRSTLVPTLPCVIIGIIIGHVRTDFEVGHDNDSFLRLWAFRRSEPAVALRKVVIDQQFFVLL